VSRSVSRIPVGAHGGNLAALAARARRPATEIIDFSANINPLGMPASVRTALGGALAELGDYPDPDCTELRQAIGAHLGVPPELVLPGNGAEQLIWWLPRLVRARRVVVTAPCYLDYRRGGAVWGLDVQEVPLDARRDFALDSGALTAGVSDGDLVWIGRPNNPTGRLVDVAAIAAFAKARPGVWWAVDEAFIEFVEGEVSVAGLPLENVILVRSMTKFYGLAGLRLGYAVLRGDLAVAGRRLLPDWSVNTLAQRAGVAVLTDPELSAFAERTRGLIRCERQALAAALRVLGASVVDGAANYLLLRLPDTAPTGAAVAERLLCRFGIAVRTCNDYVGLDARYLRVAVRGAADNARLIAGLADVLHRRGGETAAVAPERAGR
jgi:L-threonine-O-3-phosphate decarboxylase